MSWEMSRPAVHQWRGFLEVLTTQRVGEPVTVRFISVERGSRLVADRDPLSHISYFDRDDVVVVCVARVGADHIGREHIIQRPWKIIFDAPSPGAVGRIDIEGADGARTLVTLHSRGGRSLAGA